MAAQMNGKAKKSKKSAPNGQANGTLMNGHITRPQGRVKQQRSGFTWGLSVFSRILLWYTLITALLRCPSSPSELSADSPRLCKPYLALRAQSTPYVKPYYDSYLAPHVDKARPHLSRFNEQVYRPASAFTARQYSAYGAPKVEQLQSWAQSEWQRTARPHLDQASSRAKSLYDAHLSPHVSQVYTVVQPHYLTAKKTAVHTYDDVLLPAYKHALPYMQKGYIQGHHIAVDVVFPHVLQAEASTVAFLQRTLWPQLRVLYGDNVEPQLMRISERLGRYKDSKKLESVVEDTDSSSNVSSVESGDATEPLTSSSTIDNTEPASPTPEKKKHEEPEVREKIANDLRTWQEKFVSAADKGSEDLEERVKEITKRQTENQVKTVGEALIIQLEEASSSALGNLKSRIKKIVGDLPEQATEDDVNRAKSEAVEAVRSAGVTIKEKAQAIREWKKKFNQETFSLVRAATDSTLEVIDNIRDLGLQEIGMRWAWMDGVTYKDWAKYHELKKTFDEWRAEVEAVAMEHEGLKAVQSEADKIEDKGMGIAQTAAKELVRLKNVATWKISAQDSTDDFSDRVMPAGAAKAAQKVIGKASSVSAEGSKIADNAASSVSSAVVGTPEPNVAESVATRLSEGSESLASAVKNKASGLQGEAGSVVQSATESVASLVQKETNAASETIKKASSSVGSPEPVVSDASSSIQSASSIASSAVKEKTSPDAQKKVWGGAMAQEVKARNIIFDEDDEETIPEKLQNVASRAGDQAADVTRAFIEALIAPTQGSVEYATSVVNDRYQRGLSAASSALYGTSTGAAESFASAASDRYAAAVTAASYAIYGTPSPVVQSLISRASAAYDQAVLGAQEQYSKAKSDIVAQASGTPKPAHQKFLDAVEDSYSSALSLASVQYTSASASVVSAAYGPTPGPIESISSVASAKLSQGLSLASAQYLSAQSYVAGEPTPVPQQYLLDAKRRYYEAVGAIHAQYSEFVDSGSSAIYGTPTPVYEQLASKASGSIFGSPTPLYESVVSKARVNYDAAVSAASDNLQAAIAALSNKPATEQVSSDYYSARASSAFSSAVSSASATFFSASASASSVASVQWSGIVSRASEQIYGRPTPWAASAFSQAGEYGAQATSAASAQYAAVSSIISELVVGREPDFSESIMSRLSSAYYTGAVAAASSASSAASEVYASVTSVVSAAFTPPASLESILLAASEQIDAAVEAASVQVYGKSKGTVEQASSSVASAYDSASKLVSEGIYGTQPSYIEAAQKSMADAASSAQAAISNAIYGTPAGTVEAATSSVGSLYASVTSVAGENLAAAESYLGDSYNSAASAASSVIYGPEQGALESASKRLAAAVETAQARLSKFATDMGEGVSDTSESLSSKVEELASSAASLASSVASTVTARVKDEL